MSDKEFKPAVIIFRWDKPEHRTVRVQGDKFDLLELWGMGTAELFRSLELPVSDPRAKMLILSVLHDADSVLKEATTTKVNLNEMRRARNE